MSTQFVSKSSNYMVVLKNGIEGNRILGTQPVSGIYIKFEGGIVTVKEDSIAELLRNHPSFGTDFIEVEEKGLDPYADNRESIEPVHNVAEIKYGHVEKKVDNTPAKLSPQLKKLIEGEAIRMLPDLLRSNPQILKGILASMATELKDLEKSEAKPETKKETVDTFEELEETLKEEPLEETKEETVAPIVKAKKAK